VFESDEATFQTAWFVLSLLTELAVVLILRTRGPAWRSAPSRLLLCTTLAVGLLAAAMPYTGLLASAFGFVQLPGDLMLASLAIVAAYVLATELAKIPFYRPKLVGVNRER
jgi:Mg2+-importing ATPase